MKVFVGLMFAILPVTLTASTVLWNYLTNYRDYGMGPTQQMNAAYYESGEGYTEMTFSVMSDGLVVAEGCQATTWAGIVDLGFSGEVIDSMAFVGDKHFIYQLSYATVYGTDYTFHVDPGDTFYLIFQTSTYSQESDPYFGWAKFYVDEGYRVSLVNSAVGLEHQPMIVGGGSASPEPSGVLLLLLGMGVLGLRRRGQGLCRTMRRS